MPNVAAAFEALTDVQDQGTPELRDKFREVLAGHNRLDAIRLAIGRLVHLSRGAARALCQHQGRRRHNIGRPDILSTHKFITPLKCIILDEDSVPAEAHVFIATPCYGGNVHHVYMTSVVRLLETRKDWLSFTLGLLAGDALITRARNNLVSLFLDEPKFTHILFIDADISFEPAQVERMLNFDVEVVAGMYPIKVIDWARLEKMRMSGEEPLRTAGLRYVGKPHDEPDREERDGFVSATYAGTGFMLIKRGAIEKMIGAYPELRYEGIHQRDWWATEGKPSGNNYALFDCIIDQETGIYLSEDFTFCRRWTAIGGQIWLDTAGKLTHVGFGVFQGDPGLRFSSVAREQETAAER